MKKMKSAGGWAAIYYSLRMAQRVGWFRLFSAMSSKNTCKTCALGMGGQLGGMRNEQGSWPEVCKKSFQAMVADMQSGITPAFFARYSLRELYAFTPRELEIAGRLTTPVYAGPGDTHYRPVTWDFALDRVAQQLRESQPDENFFYASGRSSNEAGFLLQLLARLYGTNYVNNCSYYCHQASGEGLKKTIGNGTATVGIEDLEKADLFFLIGGNPASNHPRMMTTLMHIRRRGGKIIVINPVRELGLIRFSVPSDPWSLFFGTAIASQYVQPHIGGDLALLTAVAKLLLERGQVNQVFIDQVTEGFIEWSARVRNADWTALEHASGVDRATITQIADTYAAAKNVVFGWTMGITHHLNGVDNVRAIVNLALLRGMVGRPHAGLLPIRGHSNVQGHGTVGVVPNLKQTLIDNLERHLGVTLPKRPGLDTMACMEAAYNGNMQSAFCLGGNLFGSNPDADYAQKALAKLKLVTYLNTTLNTTHVAGRGQETLILPVLARDEEPHRSTQESMFNFVRLSAGGRPRHVGPRHEASIIADIGRRVFADRPCPVDWQKLPDHACIRDIMVAVVPEMKDLPLLERRKREFHIPNRVLHTPTFPTSSGKAQFSSLTVPPLLGNERQLRLMTVRSEGQFNTVVYEEQDIYRTQERRDVILLHPDDLTKFGLTHDQRVTVTSSAGTLTNVLARGYADIRAGNALMYFPEANVLVPKAVDPVSKTPAFKNVLITVTPMHAATNGRTALPVV
jgi:molybdopterin-dependent oxidoreductase alpha subunit